MSLARVLAFISTVMLSVVARADECPPNSRHIKATFMTEGMPDQQGLIAGKPNPNVLAPGDDILFDSGCVNDLCGWTVDMSLKDDRMQDIPVTVENITPSAYFRVHPATALTPGTYTLRYVGTNAQGERCDELVYVFRVAEQESAKAPDYVASLGNEKYGLHNGEPFHCWYWSPHSDEGGEFFLNSRPYREIVITPAKPVTDAQRDAFLSRVRITQGPDIDRLARWEKNSDAYTYWLLNEQLPHVCFVLETLQISTLQVVTGPEQCFDYSPSGAPYDPEPFYDCTIAGGSAPYARAWCETNRAACSASNPRSAEQSVRNVCATYVDICAPLLGKRAEAEGVCQ